MKKSLVMFLAMLVVPVFASAARDVYDLNRGWKFYTCDERDSLNVDLPHTWNTDALAGSPDYYRGTGNYIKYVKARPQWRGKRIFLRFEGASAVTDLLVNGRYVGQHKGGCNAFEFEITDCFDFGGNNLLWVMVSNAERTDVLPTAGEDNVYGGITRGVELVVTDGSAIGFDGFGGNGVKMVVAQADAGKAAGCARVSVNSKLQHAVQVGMRISDARDSVVFYDKVRHRADNGVTVAEIPFEVDDPHLWQGVDDPYLYRVTVSLDDGIRTDSVSFLTGFRSFSVDPDRGLSLNGHEYPLRGVVLWRDRAMSGPVSTVAQMEEDLDIICEMGANAVRVAGGSHYGEFYEMCDRRGIVVLADSPFTGASAMGTRGFYDSPAFRENALSQLKETICQRYNNPSVFFWGIFSDPELRGDDPIPFIGVLNDEAHGLDGSRLTVGISNKDGDINRIPDLIVWNHTFGWLSGMPEDITIWDRQLRGDKKWNRICSAVSYRVGGGEGCYAESLKRPDPYRGCHAENWQAHVHEVHIAALGNQKRYWGVFVGDMFDHGSVSYPAGNGEGLVDCGLVTFDRKVRKDAYWLYKANWNHDDPFIYITGNRHPVRESEVQDITVYSNLPTVELSVNGVSQGVVSGKNGIFVWRNVKLVRGDNEVYAFSVMDSGDDYVTVEDSASLVCAPGSVL